MQQRAWLRTERLCLCRRHPAGQHRAQLMQLRLQCVNLLCGIRRSARHARLMPWAGHLVSQTTGRAIGFGSTQEVIWIPCQQFEHRSCSRRVIGGGFSASWGARVGAAPTYLAFWAHTRLFSNRPSA